MEIQENLVFNVIELVLKTSESDLKTLNRTLSLPKLPLRRIPFYEAKEILKNELGIDEPIEDDFSTPAETALSKHFEDPFFLTKFPTHLRGMYYETDPNNEN